MGKKRKTKSKTTTKTPTPLFHGFLLVLAGFVAYVGTLNNPMVFDDLVFIEGNAALTNPDGLGQIWSFNPARFLVMLSFVMNHAVHGLDVWGYHLINLGFHLVAGLLAWQLALALLTARDNETTHSARLIALGVGFIFICHPLQTQAVAYIWQRSAVMAATFYLASMLAYTRHRLAGGKGFSKAAFFFGLAAMFCKEIAFTLPLALVMVEMVFFDPKPMPAFKRLWYYALLLLVIPITVLASRQQYTDMLAVEPESTGPTPVEYVLTQPRVTLTYLRLLFVPVNQNLDYDYRLSRGLADPSTLVSILALFLLAGGTIWMFKRDRALYFSSALFFLALSVEAMAFTLPDVIFEHRLYLPMFAFGLFVCDAVGSRVKPQTFGVVLLCLTLPLIGISFMRNAVWDSPWQLWQDTASKSPEKARPQLNMGIASREAGKDNLALTHLNKAVEIEPENPLARLHRAMLHQSRSNWNQALADFAVVLEARPDDHPIRNNRGAVYLKMKRFDMALTDFDQILAAKPDYVPALKNRASYHQLTGNPQLAIADYQKALQAASGDGETWHQLANACKDAGRNREAEEAFREALRINGEQAPVLVDLSTLLYGEGRKQEALEVLNRAITADPKYKPARINRGSIAFNDRHFQQAIDDFNVVLATEENGDLLYRRGAAWLSLGDKTKARNDFTRARELGITIPQQAWDQLNQ